MIASVRLNKQTKTIKVVNRRNNIRLSHIRENNLRLQHTGQRGPQGIQGVKGDKGDKGDQGETGVSTFVRAHHAANAAMSRPLAQFVEWVGSVAPLNATTEDTWIHTPA